MDLSNRTVVVTGGSSGIGLAFALRLQSQGNTVIVTSRNQETLTQVTRDHPGLIGLRGDVGDPQSVRHMAEFLERQHPKLSVLFHSAGIMRPFSLLDPALVLEASTAEVDTNLKGTIWMTEALLPLLSRQDEAMIVTVSSGLSYVSAPQFPVYSATKAGVSMFTTALRVQLRRAGTKVHVMELVPPLVGGTNLLPPGESSFPAMSLDTLVRHGIRGMERNAKRVVPGMSKVLRFAGKVFPDAMSNAMPDA